MKRQIQHGLVVLIQQNLLYHHLDESDDRTYYEANHDGAYALVRTGKIVELVNDRYGTVAKDIVQNLLLLGHGRVSDLEAAYQATNNAHTNSDSMRHNDTNHLHSINGKSQSLSVGQLHSVLTRLLQSGFVEPVMERMFRSPTDTQNVVEKEELRRNYGGQTKGTRQKEELKIKVRQQLKSWRDGGRGWQLVGSKGPGERMNGINGQGKKRRLSRGEAAVNGNHVFQDDGLQLDVSFKFSAQQDRITC
jgi:DNA-directed RNA polymerase III subunit RPC3